ncbi:sialic acid-binding Ig-like lectin 14 [Anomaloglossus baeobatrachus]|uniref:sialic acid-binding Ig-like lectin 14 n=1 Tax=Anomaloglossus baeobatrachus TaxID=238106 RepID=UPI003F504E1B
MPFKRIRIFGDCLSFILIVSQLWSNINCQKPGYEIHTDEIVHVQRGLCTYVPCKFTVPTTIILRRNTNGFWLTSRAKTVAVAYRINSLYYTNGRFYLIGDVTRGDCSFYIEEPRSIDEGVYAFRIEDPQAQFTYTDTLPYVDVTELTDKPTISSTRLVDGEEVTMTCTSPGKCRSIVPTYISWEGAMTGTRLMIYNISYEDGSRTFHSNITFTPRKSHNNSPFLCRVGFKEGLFTMDKQMLNVEYSPSMIITTEGVDANDTASVIVEDGDSVTLNCIVDSNPNASVIWYKEDMVVHRNMNKQVVTLQLINITESDAGRYQCSAMNEHGVAKKSIQIIYLSTMPESSPVIAAAVGGAMFLLLIILIGVLLFMYFRKKGQHISDGNLKDASGNYINEIYSYPEFTTPDVSPPEKTLQKEVNAVDDAIYVNSDDVQYSRLAFSKNKHKVIQEQEDIEIEYSEIKKVPHK